MYFVAFTYFCIIELRLTMFTIYYGNQSNNRE